MGSVVVEELNRNAVSGEAAVPALFQLVMQNLTAGGLLAVCWRATRWQYLQKFVTKLGRGSQLRYQKTFYSDRGITSPS